MSMSAIIPVARVPDANAALEAAGWGPGNFFIPAYAGPSPTHGVLHIHGSGPALEDIKALTDVQVIEGAGTVREKLTAAAEASGAALFADAPELPDSGQVEAGKIYKGADIFWYVIQQHDRGTFGGDPTQYPALIREARIPGQVRPWRQPLDQFDAYLTVNPFTGEPDRVKYDGSTWEAVDGSAGGPGGARLNTWTPGVFGWTQI